jgi:hypothetical protein
VYFTFLLFFLLCKFPLYNKEKTSHSFLERENSHARKCFRLTEAHRTIRDTAGGFFQFKGPNNFTATEIAVSYSSLNTAILSVGNLARSNR